MNRTALIGALIVSLAAGSAALADGRHDNDRRGRNNDHREHGQVYRHDYRDDHRGDYRHDYRGDYRHDYRPGPSPRYGTYYRPRGYYSHRWVRGERLPVAFYARPYWVADYRGWGYAPPRGYHWVRVNGDAVLAAIATGIVLDTVFDAFH